MLIQLGDWTTNSGGHCGNSSSECSNNSGGCGNNNGECGNNSSECSSSREQPEQRRLERPLVLRAQALHFSDLAFCWMYCSACCSSCDRAWREAPTIMEGFRVRRKCASPHEVRVVMCWGMGSSMLLQVVVKNPRERPVAHSSCTCVL